MSPDSKLAMKYGAGKTKTAQITKCNGYQFLVVKKPNVLGVSVFEEIILEWLLEILFLPLRLYPPVTRK